MSQFEYVAVLISIIVGLALTQILRGIGRLVSTEDGPAPYWVHLVWNLYLFLLIVAFWWWEFRLDAVEWSLSLYLIVIIYATLLFFASLLIQPATTENISCFKDYYYSRRRWIFGLLAAIWLWDLVDTLSKGGDHFLNLGIGYMAFASFHIIGSIAAMITASERYHQIFAVTGLSVFIAFQYRTFFVIS